MPSYFVRQPNGKLAVFSTIVDHFTEVDLTRKDAEKWCDGKGITGKVIDRGWNDEPDPDYVCCDQKPLRRWHRCLSTILHVHGTEELAKFLTEYRCTYEKSVAPALEDRR